MDNISFDYFKKMELKVAEIKTAEDIEGADRIYKLRVDMGEPEERRVVAGIKQFYTKEELVGKKVVVLSNLEPKELKGEMSHGMLLAAVEEEPRRVVVITVDKDVKNGTRIS
jgi:methionine--tRNA ligase beta chain